MGVCLLVLAKVAEARNDLGVFLLQLLTQSMHDVFREDVWLEFKLTIRGLGGRKVKSRLEDWYRFTKNSQSLCLKQWIFYRSLHAY